jgi:two-component system, chemotaxis family, chemotaxis protein CheY
VRQVRTPRRLPRRIRKQRVPRIVSDALRSVLVVDDDRDIRQALAEVLREWGRQVTTAMDGFDALGKLASLSRPCLILLDLMMPRMSGLEFLEHLSQREDADEFAVVVMSAHDGLRKEAARHANVQGTLRKPFDFDVLLSMVQYPLGPTPSSTSPTSGVSHALHGR